MNQGVMIAGMIGLLASLFLAVRPWRSHGLSFENTAWMTVAWALIITVLAFVLGRVV